MFSKKVTKGSNQLSRTRTFRRSDNEVQYTDDERCWWEDSAAGKPKIVNCNQYAISPSALNKHRRKSFTSELNEKITTQEEKDGEQKKLTNAAKNVFKITESLSDEASFYISGKLNDTSTEIPSVFFFTFQRQA